jgi:small subunit ribosomal protein S6
VPTYESIFIIDPALTEEGIQSLIGKMQNLIASGGGEISKLEKWGKRKLSYKVDGKKEGFYVFFEYRGTPKVMEELQRNFRFSDPIIKYTTVKSGD